VRDDGVVKVFIVTNSDRDGDAFSFIVDLDDNLGGLELLYLFLDQLLSCFLFVSREGVRLFDVDLGLGVSQGGTATFFGFALRDVFSFVRIFRCGTSAFALHVNNLKLTC
jgi:hypothetical protein